MLHATSEPADLHAGPGVRPGRDWWFLVAMAVSLAAVVAPIWTAALLPYMDFPQHLATSRILHSLDDPAFGMTGLYEIDLSSTQYLAYYFLVEVLAWITPLETAHRLALSLYAVTLPLSVAAYMAAFGRDRAVGLLAAPLVHNTFLYMGFANYLLALPLVFWGLALLRRLMDQWSARRAALLAGITVVLFYMHAQALLGGRGLHPRHWWRQALHLAPALTLMLVWVARSAILAGEEAWTAGHGGRNVSPVQARWEPLMDRLTALPRQLLDAYRDDADERVLFALLALALVLLLFRRAAPPADEVTELGAPRAWLRARTPEIITLALLAVTLLSPISYKWIWPISHRMIPVVALFALAALAWRTLPLRPVLLILPATLLTLYASHVHIERADAFAEEAGAVRDVLTHAEPGRRLHALIYDRGSRHINHAPYLHFGQYYVVDRGGVATFSFVDFPQSPVRYDPERGPPRLPNRFEWTPEKFDLAKHGDYYDYFLIRDGGRRKARKPFGRRAGEVELVHRDGRWALYKRKAAFEPG